MPWNTTNELIPIYKKLPLEVTSTPTGNSFIKSSIITTITHCYENVTPGGKKGIEN